MRGARAARVSAAVTFAALVGCASEKKHADAPAEDAGVVAPVPDDSAAPAPTTCSDGVRNGSETDIDCGGGAGCSACATGKGCAVASDCVSQLCQGAQCLPPSSCSDGVKNGTETDVDCGGGACAPCANGKTCNAGPDCQVGSCVLDVCQAPACTDKAKNGNETDIDCGGSDCAPCADGLGCAIASDCVNSVCQTTCQAPTCTDGVKNGPEIGPDCGASCQACPPADPSTLAPTLSKAAATSTYDAWSFLFSGANPIQTGVDVSKIDPRRMALIRGHVRDRNGAAMPYVKVQILARPEFGQTISRLDGGFDLVVNGGESLALALSRAGVLPSQRRVTLGWQESREIDDVVLVAYDGAVTKVDFSAPIQVARQNAVTDADGTRRATLLFQQGTTATMSFADGSTQPLSTVNVRATEYTVGASGDRAMPGSLPPTSAYTYAVELSVDEAVNAGATQVDFTKPVTMVLENFWNMPTGTHIPLGYYDRKRAAWIGVPNGRVIKILSIANGKVEVDADGDGNAEDALGLAALGITDDERTTLATIYSAGQSLWRSQVQHFTPWDTNWPYGPPDGARAPGDPYPGDDEDADDCCEESGSIIEVQNQGLGESIPVIGTPYSLNYRSRRLAPEPAKVLQLTGSTVPGPVKSVELEVSVAGQSFKKSFAPSPNLTHTFAWDGKDGFGRDAVGTHKLYVRVGYSYEMEYKATPEAFAASFAMPGTEEILPFIARGRKEFTVWRDRELTVRRWDLRGQGFGGWTLSGHHVLDPVAGLLARGDGNNQWGFPQGVQARTLASARPTRSAPVLASVVVDDSLPSAQPLRVTFSPEGKVYWSDNRNYINTIDASGKKVHVAGSGYLGDFGDGGQALSAGIREPQGLAIGPDGALYVASWRSSRIRRIDLKSGIITAVVNVAGVEGVGGDGGPATAANLTGAMDLTFAPDGAMYIADGYGIRRVSPDGIMATYGGGFVNGTGATYPKGTENVEARRTAMGATNYISLDAAGNVYFAEAGVGVRRITPSGIIETIAADLSFPQVRLDGTLFATNGSCQGLEVSPERVRRVILGGGTCLATPIDGVLGTAANGQFFNLELGPDESIYSMPYGYPWRIRGLTANPPLGAAYVNNRNIIPKKDGSALFSFSGNLHIETLDLATGAIREAHAHDTSGRLVKITDSYGLETTIERDSNGNPTAIVAPGGQKTTLELDTNGYLSKLTHPDGKSWNMTSTSIGMLTKLVDPAGGTHNFTYDADGRLTKDEDPLTGSKSFARQVPSLGTVTTTMTTGLGRVSSFSVARQADESETRTDTDSSGGVTRSDLTTHDTVGITALDGVVTTTEFGPDPRFGRALPLVTKQTRAMPSGLTSLSTATRTVTTSPSDPLSVTAQTDTLSINGRTIARSWDSSAGTVTLATSSGFEGTLTFDGSSRLVATSSNGVTPITSTYDANGRLASKTQGAATSSWTYDSALRVANRTTPLGQSISYSYDANGRVVKLTLPSGRAYVVAYGANGLATALTMPNGTVHHLTYDLRDSLTSFGIGGSSPLQYSYDFDRAMTGMTLPGGQVGTVGFDTAGRILGFSATESATSVTYLDNTRRISAVTYAPTGGGTAQQLQFTYDGELLTGIAYSGNAAGTYSFGYDANFWRSSHTFDGVTTNLSRDDEGRVTAMTNGAATYSIERTGPLRRTSKISDGLQFVQAITYDASGREATRAMTFGGTVRYQAALTYDAIGRLASKTETVDATTHTDEYTYDLDGQLTGVKRDGLAHEQYTYDLNGNRTAAALDGVNETSTFDAEDRITASAGATYACDSGGRLVTRGADAFTYGTRGELLSATVGGKTIAYGHDGWGRRVSRTDGPDTTQYFYGATEDLVTHVRRPGGAVTEYFYDDSGRMFAFHRSGKRYFVATDQVGTPRIVVDDAGVVVKKVEMDAFGRLVTDSNPTFDLDLGFAGGIADPVTGWTRFGWRDYDPRAGRWAERDPLLYWGKSYNLYRYARNQPVLLRDPDGRKVKLCSNPMTDPILKTVVDIGTYGQWKPRHYWLSAGGHDGGLLGFDGVVMDHSGFYEPSTICEDVDDADETCVADKIIPNVSPAWIWTPVTNCYMFAKSVLAECTPPITDVVPNGFDGFSLP
jgi:RHS repeat-associated protein